MRSYYISAQKVPDFEWDHFKVVKDLLPGPEGLSFRKERILTLRLDEPTIAELKEIADNKDLGMSTLVRMWVRERLAGNA